MHKLQYLSDILLCVAKPEHWKTPSTCKMGASAIPYAGEENRKLKRANILR